MAAVSGCHAGSLGYDEGQTISASTLGTATPDLKKACHAGRLGYDEGQTKRLAAELVDSLSSMGNLAGAATVAVQYLADIDNGVSLLTQAREWREALRTSYRSATPLG